MFSISADPEDPDASKVYSGKTKAYSLPDRKRVKVRVCPSSYAALRHPLWHLSCSSAWVD